jgi:hypothetical protein
MIASGPTLPAAGCLQSGFGFGRTLAHGNTGHWIHCEYWALDTLGILGTGHSVNTGH